MQIGQIQGAFGVVVVCLFLLSFPARGQVTISPQGVFLGPDSRHATLSISNGSSSPQEVEISFQFAYPTTTQSGKPVMVRSDSSMQASHDLTPYLSVYPKAFVLPPGGSKSVRVFVEGRGALPAELTKGARWTRLVTKSTPQERIRQVSAEEAQANVRIGIRQIMAAVYRSGNARANIEMGTPQVRPLATDSSKLAVQVPVDHGGEAPFWGTAQLKLYGEGGRHIKTYSRRTAIYNDMVLTFAHRGLKPEDVPPGDYTAEITISPQRADIPEQYHSKLGPLSQKARLNVPAL